jgi:enterochelin esterase family protein
MRPPLSHALLAILCLLTPQLLAVETKEVETFDSPRIADLAKQLTSGDAQTNRAVIDAFVHDMHNQAPLVEPVADDPHSRYITFLWHGDAATQIVFVLGGPTTTDPGAKLARLADTDLWYRTDKIPSDARFVYKFQTNLPERMPRDPAAHRKLWQENPPKPDPLNPHPIPDSQGSLAELPDAPAQPWLERVPGLSNQIAGAIEKTLTGRVVREFTFKSDILKQDRQYAVYTPPAYEPKADPCGLLVMFDGGACSRLTDSCPVPIILDNLIREKKLPPTVALFVYQTDDRTNELGCNERFADFLATELIPHLRSQYHVTADPKRTIIGGMSLGGLMSSFCTYRHPEVFGNVLSLSGSYQWTPGLFEGKEGPDIEPGWLTRQFTAHDRLPIHFFLCAGRFENFFPYSLLGENRRFRDVLLAKGYTVNYTEFSGGHDPVCWRGPFVEGIMKVTAASQQ